MSNFWVGLLVAIVIVIVVGAGSMIWLVSAVTKETIRPVATLNPAGATGSALLIYHPGLSDFPDRVVSAFAEGLAQSGWRIDQTTASKEAPKDFGSYDLIILGSPVYGGLSKPLSDYVARVGDFAGKPVVILLTGAGDTAATLKATTRMVEASKGVVVERLAYTTMRPNESPKAYQGSNVEKAIAMARDAGAALSLPPR